MIYVGIDPGTSQSAWAMWGVRLAAHGIARNQDLPEQVESAIRRACWNAPGLPAAIAIEQVCCYGRPVGAEVFAAVWWSGIFQVRLGSLCPVGYVTKPRLCRFMLGKSGGTDAEIRAALIERFGKPGRSRTKPEGVLWGVKADEWLAVAYAVALADGIDTSPSY